MISDEHEFEVACYMLAGPTLKVVEELSAYNGRMPAGDKRWAVNSIRDIFLADDRLKITHELAVRIMATRGRCESQPKGLDAKAVALRLGGMNLRAIADVLAVTRWRVGKILRKEVWRRRAAGEPIPKKLLPRATDEFGNMDYSL